MKRLDNIGRAFFIALILMVGCSNPFGTDEGGGGGGGNISRKSPDALINFFVYVYQARDLRGYEEALEDRFVFELREDDADALGLPPDRAWWSKQEELKIAGRMFDPDFVPHENFPKMRNIQISLAPSSGWRDAELIIGDDKVDTFLRKYEPDMSIFLEYADGSSITKLVKQSQLDIWVTQDTDNPGLWKIIKMKETRKPGS
ncbi:MAG: hypothetical protein ACUVUU_04130 [bacterium]